MMGALHDLAIVKLSDIMKNNLDMIVLKTTTFISSYFISSLEVMICTKNMDFQCQSQKRVFQNM